MYKALSLAFLLIISIFPAILSAGEYPFSPAADQDIAAYWYNVRPDSVTFRVNGMKAIFRSTLQIFGKAPGDTFAVEAVVSGAGNMRVFARKFNIRDDKAWRDSTFSVSINNGYFHIICPVNHLAKNPETIKVTVSPPGGEKTTRTIQCRYHRLYGAITDFEGKPFRAFVTIRPDAFDFETTVWSDSTGWYSIELPERTYSNIAVVNEDYGVDVAESWAWHIIHDADQRLDFKVGTGEVYNLKAWPNNGGFKTYFISFRPMDIAYFRSTTTRTVSLNGAAFTLPEHTADLEPGDITVRFNGKEARIISLQRYYETGPCKAMAAILLQVDRSGLEKTGKQTVTVEYRKEIEAEGKKTRSTSMGHCQLQLNFYGLSEY